MLEQSGVGSTGLTVYYCKCGREVVAPQGTKAVQCDRCTQAAQGINVFLTKDPDLDRWLWEMHPEGVLLPRVAPPEDVKKREAERAKLENTKAEAQRLLQIARDIRAESDAEEAFTLRPEPPPAMAPPVVPPVPIVDIVVPDNVTLPLEAPSESHKEPSVPVVSELAPSEPQKEHKRAKNKGPSIANADILAVIDVPLKAKQIHEALAASNKIIKISTLNNILKKLVQDGKLTRVLEEREGKGRRGYLYSRTGEK